MLAGWRPVTPFIAPIGGAVLAGVAGALTVLVDGTEVGWFVPLAIAVNAAASASWLARRESRRSRTGARPSLWLWIAGAAGVLVVAGVSAWSMRSLVSVDIGPQARSIWLAHARWIADGHNAALSALTNPGLAVAHSSYPPLGGSVVALGWVITGVSSDRVGEIVLAILTGCAVAAGGATILEVGMIASARSGAARARLATASRLSIVAVSAAAGAAWVLGAYGLAGAGATNGSVDLLWSAAAVGAAGMGLVLPLSGEHARAAMVLAVAAGLTKYEGIVAAVAFFVLVAVRWLAFARPRSSLSGGGPSRRRGVIAATACAFGVAGVVAWPVGAALRHATEDDYLTGQRVGSFLSRAGATWDAMTAQLHLAGLALVIGIAAALVLSAARRQRGFGSDVWIWALGVGEVVAIAGAYVIGTNQARSWLVASVDRTTLFANCLGLALVAWWLVIGIGIATGPPGLTRPPGPVDISGTPSGSGDRSSAVDGDGVDAGVPAVLHPRP
jgi:hypothetical protein